MRPRYEGANICTWIGFKHVNYLVEEAVLAHFRSRRGAGRGAVRGLRPRPGPGRAATPGCCTPCTWTTRCPRRGDRPPPRRTGRSGCVVTVTGGPRRPAAKAVTARVAVVLRVRRPAVAPVDARPGWPGSCVPGVAAAPASAPPRPARSPTGAGGPAGASSGPAGGTDPLLDRLTAGRNASAGGRGPLPVLPLHRAHPAVRLPAAHGGGRRPLPGRPRHLHRHPAGRPELDPGGAAGRGWRSWPRR